MIAISMEVSVSNVEIPMQVSSNVIEIPVDVEVKYVNVAGEYYSGEMEVESLLYSPYFLETENRIMPGNLVVKPITILDVENPAGGYTITIGKF